VGKSGQITPVAIFDPIEIDGVTINRATLHNKQFILDQDIRIGDRIVVARANDVIPKVIRAAVEARTKELNLPEIPTKCPSCGEDIWIQPDVPHITCLNPFCREQMIEKIIHFCSRDAMDIEGMGEINVRTLFDLGFIQSPADLYSLNNKAEEIEKIEGFGQTKVNKILEGIEKSKDLPLSRLLYALAIPGVGKTTAQVIAKKFRTLENVQGASKEKLADVDGVGSVTAIGIWSFFLYPQTQEMIYRLVDTGINTEETVTETKETLSGKTFVLTGTMSLPRSEIETLIKQNGGKVSGSVSSKTSFLVAAPGETGTTKYQKATQLGIPIISESQLMEMLA
jgi:DNA ligase (NAD+)